VPASERRTGSRALGAARASAEQPADASAGEQELRLGREAAAVPSALVEEAAPARAQPGSDVLEVWEGAGGGAEHRWIADAPPGREQGEAEQPAPDLEPPVGDVLVPDAVACDVQRRPEQKRQRPRPGERTGGAADGDVERDDHQPIMAYAARMMSMLERLRRLLAGPPRVDDRGREGAEVDATMAEELAAGDEGAADLERMETTTGGPPAGGLASSEAAEAGAAEIASEAPPPDPAP